MIEIRNAEHSDLPCVAEIHVASWRAAYRQIVPDEILDSLSAKDRLEAWNEWILVPNAQLWVTTRGEVIVGFCRLVQAPSPDGYDELTHLYLDPVASGSGLGYLLFRHAMDVSKTRDSKGLFLWVLEENVRARRFYERAEMELDGGRQSRPDWLGEGVFEVRYRTRL